MLTRFYENLTVFADPSILRDLAEKIHAEAMGDSDFDEWFSRLVFIIPRRDGGIAFTVDKHNPKIAWFDAYHPGYLPRRKTWRAIVMLLSSLGFDYAATHTVEPVLKRFHLKSGMQELKDNVFSICLRSK